MSVLIENDKGVQFAVPTEEELSGHFASLGESINMTINDMKKVWEKAPAAEDKAELEESIATSVKKASNDVVPLAIGGFSAIVFSELTDGLMINQNQLTRGLAKGAVAIGLLKWGKKLPFLGNTGTKIAAVLVGFDALRDITPISSWASQVANAVSGALPVGGLGDQRGRDVVAQANNVARNYRQVSRGGW